MGGGPRLAERVAGVPEHLGEVLALFLGGEEGVDDGPASVGAGGEQADRGDHRGGFGSQGGPVDVVGPAHLSRLNGQMELVADVGAGRTAVGGRAVAGSSVGV